MGVRVWMGGRAHTRACTGMLTRPHGTALGYQTPQPTPPASITDSLVANSVARVGSGMMSDNGIGSALVDSTTDAVEEEEVEEQEDDDEDDEDDEEEEGGAVGALGTDTRGVPQAPQNRLTAGLSKVQLIRGEWWW